jgi:NADPH:quinone reductase-like Zn-dependent oxidoreductase
MKAAYIEQFGGPEVVKYGDLPDPSAGAGQIVVDAFAASVNGADWKVRVGHHGQQKFPLVLGRDFSGVVSAVGAGVTDLRIGDEVFGVLELGREGAYAEKVFIAASLAAKKPSSVSHVDAAALALTGLTALCSVEDALKLKSGETILIQGGAGGVASFAIQLAKHLGARVITTASAANEAYLRDIGADQVIDYNATDFTKAVNNCDAVLDTVGGDVAARSFAVLKPGGRAAFIASGAKAPTPARSDVTALRPIVGRDRPHLERIAALYQTGVIRSPEVTLYKLSEAVEATRASEARHVRGKLVFKVR